MADIRVPWNDNRDDNNGYLNAIWNAGATLNTCAGRVCQNATSDRTFCGVQQSNLTCAGIEANGPYDFGVYSLQANVCNGGFGTCLCSNFHCGGCHKYTEIQGIPFVVTGDTLGCDPPVEHDCTGGDSCSTCIPSWGEGGGSSSPAGQGSSAAPAMSGPGARLRYVSGGVGRPNTAGETEHRRALGIGWAHDYSVAVYLDPVVGDETDVWLAMESGSFRHFTNLEAGTGRLRYQDRSPADEKRDLYYDDRTGEWELVELDGTVLLFDASGRWRSTIDRFDNATTGCYDNLATCSGVGPLIHVSKPDGRSEVFAYEEAGKLTSITEVGVGVTDCAVTPEECRTWSYRWVWHLLTQIDMPDGRAWRFDYEDPRYQTYMTRMTLIGTDQSERLDTAWQYDEEARVIAMWRGDVTMGTNGPEPGPNAVDLWQYSFESFDPNGQPTEVDVSDPLGDTATRFYSRPSGQSKPRLDSVMSQVDSCSVCGFGPNTSFDYVDSVNPLLPTTETDASGNDTVMTYNAFGLMTSRVEAATTAEERTTTWIFSGDFPGLVTEMREESVAGEPTEKIVHFEYVNVDSDPEAEFLESRWLEGVESGSALTRSFTETFYGDSPAGQTATVDPPGFGTNDVTTYAFDEIDRGGLVVTARTDPDPSVVGGATTTFHYDAFNRRVGVTDPNGVTTETQYDELDRVRFVIQRTGNLGSGFELGDAAQPGDLVTEHQYNSFGDLDLTILPRSTVVDYGYDSIGRLDLVHRRLDQVSNGERVKYVLDDSGNRTLVTRERWDGSWLKDTETEYVFEARCRLWKIIQAPGTAEEAVTEQDYDCKGNLSHSWDANHPLTTGTDWTRELQYDELDRLVLVREPWDANGNGILDDGVFVDTSYAYDVQDHLISVTDANGNATVYGYSDRGLMTAETSPVSGQTTHTYNEHGLLVTTNNARGVLIENTLDELGRVGFVNIKDNGIDADDLDIDYTYGADPLNFSIGRLVGIARDSQTISLSYDRFGRLMTDGDLSFDYDENGNRIETVYPGHAGSGELVANRTFDFADREEALTLSIDGGNDIPLATAAKYLAGGPLRVVTLGNSLVETRSYDQRFFPAAIAVDDLVDWGYTTDDVGNVTEISEATPCGDLDLSNQTVTGTESFEACGILSAGPDFRVDSPDGDATFVATDAIILRSGFSVAQAAEFTATIDPDLVGSPTAATRAFSYQPPQYFLRTADGPWGELEWTYDAIGSRLTEVQVVGGATLTNDDYNYVGTTPILDHVDHLGIGGSRDYTYGAAGHVESVTSGANVIDHKIDAAGRLAGLERQSLEVEFSYDGRGFLRDASQIVGGSDTLEALYDSAGTLHRLVESGSGSAAQYHFYLSGRPIAQVSIDGAGLETLSFVTTDHLGTPILLTDNAGAETWSGGFEPFGKDWRAGLPDGALESGVILRLPGQWESSLWGDASMGAAVSYNVHRWYETGTGRYSRVDPMTADLAGRARFLGQTPFHSYSYAESNPLVYLDPLGLEVEVCSRPNEIPQFDGVPVLDDLPHRWLKTPNKEAGLGNEDGSVPGDRVQCGCIGTAVTDHTAEGRKSGVTCKVLKNVDEDCVERNLVIGQRRGKWIPVLNDCWSLVDSIVARCRNDRPKLNPAGVK